MNKSKRNLWIMMAIVFIIAILIACCVWRFSMVDNLKEFLLSLSTSLIGIGVSIYLIEIIINNARKQEIEEKSNKKARRIICVLEPFIEEYKKAAYMITNDIEDTKGYKDVVKGFPFEKFAGLYEQQYYTMESIFETKVELYFEKVDRLKSVILNILLNVDLTNLGDFAELFAKYVEEMEKDYPKNALLKYQNDKFVVHEGKSTKKTKMITQLMKNEVKDTKVNKILLPVKRLYKIIEYHVDFIDKYNKYKLIYGINCNCV